MTILRLLVVSACAVSAAADPIDDFLRGEMRRANIPGMAVAVVDAGKARKVAGYGFAAREKGRAVTPDTVFQIGSVSKQFAAKTALALAEQGRLSLDEPVTKRIPSCPAWSRITVRHLLTHTSGIPDWGGRAGWSFANDYTPEQLVEWLCAQGLEREPGEDWAYSSAGYALLGIILERAGGRPFSELVREAVFQPLRMSKTAVYQNGRSVQNEATGYAGDSQDNRPGPLHRPLVSAPSGGVISTLADLVRYEQHLAESDTRALREPAALTGGRTAPYGMGWALDYDGKPVMWHGGATGAGFSSAWMRFPDGVTVILLQNAFFRDVQADRTAARVAELYRKSRGAPPAQRTGP